VSTKVNEIPDTHEAPFSIPDLAAALETGSGKCVADLFEVDTVAFQVFECDPTSFSIDHHWSPLGHPLLPGVIGSVFRKVQRRVVHVSDAEQQNVAVEVVEAGKRRSVAEGVVERVVGEHESGVRTACGERHLRMATPPNPGIAPESLGDHPHHPGRGQVRVECRRFVADDGPPRFGYRRIAPQRRLREPRGMGRHDQCPIVPYRCEQRLDHSLRTSGNPPERRHRRMHQQGHAINNAERSEVLDQCPGGGGAIGSIHRFGLAGRCRIRLGRVVHAFLSPIACCA
jgi:hypothetical protein